MKCRPGDLAVVIAAVNACNIGLIVRVLRPYDKVRDAYFRWTVPAWIVESSTPMVYGTDKVEFVGTVGPSLDEQLKPIRGPEQKSKKRHAASTPHFPAAQSARINLSVKDNMMITLERAIALASLAHEGATDKGGAPYILHPLRVMQAQATNDARIVAVFHDVCEDCEGWNFERLLAEGFTSDMVTALRSVTKVDGEDYEDFVRRAAGNPIGRSVKLADLRDNLDISRIAQLTEKDLNRVNKYKRALQVLSAA